jgi:uncharacterized protein
MQLHDRLTLDAPRRTKDGFMAVRAKAARAGVYDYLGVEVDPQGTRFKADQVVKVYRPADEVFATDSIASFIAKPVTNDHPTVAVTADNWKQHTRGAVMGALRDGDYLAFDLTIMDAAAIADVDAGKRELSNGYTCTLDFASGTAPDGQTYDAVQRNIRGNHVAIVDRGRAGSECKISDRFAVCDANPAALADFSKGNHMKKIVLDGLQVDLSDADAVAAAFTKLQDMAKTAAEEAEDAKKKMAAKDGEVAALTKQLADAKAASEPAAIDKLVADRAALVTTVKAIDASIVTDGKTDAEIRRALVEAKLGDAGKALDDAAIPGAFAVLSNDVKGSGSFVSANDTIVPIGKPMTINSRSVTDALRSARYA